MDTIKEGGEISTGCPLSTLGPLGVVCRGLLAEITTVVTLLLTAFIAGTKREEQATHAQNIQTS